MAKPKINYTIIIVTLILVAGGIFVFTNIPNILSNFTGLSIPNDNVIIQLESQQEPSASCSLVSPRYTYTVGETIMGTVSAKPNTVCTLYGFNDATGWITIGDVVTDANGIVNGNIPASIEGDFKFRAICGSCTTNTVDIRIDRDPSLPFCSDSDDGKDYMTKGTCTDIDSSDEDVCPMGAWTRFVSEGYCGTDSCLGLSKDCGNDYLCYDGQCESIYDDYDGDGVPNGYENDWGSDPADGSDVTGLSCTQSCMTEGWLEWIYMPDVADQTFEEKYETCQNAALSICNPEFAYSSIEDTYCCCYACGGD